MKKTYNIAILDEAVEKACFMECIEDKENDEYIELEYGEGEVLYENIKYCVLDHLWNKEKPLYKWRLREIEKCIHEHNKAVPESKIDVNVFMENIAFRYEHICCENDLEYEGDLIDFIAWGYRSSIRYPVFHFEELKDDLEIAA